MRSPQRGSRSLGAHDFRVSFTPLEGVLFTFPSRYSFAIGRRQYSALWDGPHGFGRGFTCPDLLGIRHENSGLRAWGCHPLRPDFPDGRARASLSFMPSRNPGGHVRRFGLVRFRSPLLAESLLISSPRGTEMFHFPRYRLHGLFYSPADGALARAGLLHSDTHGSKAACASPWTFAACRVLLRPPSPRHPSCARRAWPPVNLAAGPGALHFTLLLKSRFDRYLILLNLFLLDFMTSRQPPPKAMRCRSLVSKELASQDAGQRNADAGPRPDYPGLP